MEPFLVVDVALPVPVDETFAFALPAGLRASVGVRVVVPGRGRRMVGVVTGVRRAGAEPDLELRSVHEVLDASPALPDALVQVVLQAAAEALCPPGLALAAALPAGTAPQPGRRIALAAGGRRALERGEARGALERLLRALERRPLSEAHLRRQHKDVYGALERLETLGWIESAASTDAARVRPRTKRVHALAADADPEALVSELGRAKRQRQIVETLAAGSRSLPASEALRALIRRGVVEVREERVEREPETSPVAVDAGAFELTAAQQGAVERIGRAIREREGAPFLLYGVTGSGKTEVYLRAAEVALSLGRGVIVLVPEISLTHQVVDRFRERFGGRIAVQHSGLSGGERLDQWAQIRDGRRAIAIGARSAVFAPCEDPGLIVIDEEHDPAYKSEDHFRYHAREVALARARAAGAPLLLGSATPDVETAWRVTHGEIERLTLPERVSDRPLPEVEIVDMERERRQRGKRALLSRALRHALNETLTAGQQAILFLNRRGFATMIYCWACGHALRCKHCDISLVYHAQEGARRRDDPTEGELRCHYCGYTETPRRDCEACGSSEGGLLGFGTERLAEEVATMFPHARVARLDRDTSARKGAQQAILADFHRGDADVLVGTQMVAKGHDIPGVTLVGVVAADLGLHFPDFRAGERTFQLLTQVAGRAGRGDQPGRVVIQTFLPDHYAIALARSHDFPRFYAEEIRRRRPHGYPPFRALVACALVGPKAEKVEQAAGNLAALALELGRERALGESFEVLGPAPAPVARIRDEFRWQMLLLGPRDGLRPLARELARRARGKLSGATLRLDASPLQML